MPPEEVKHVKSNIYKVLWSDTRVKIAVLPTFIIGSVNAIYYLFFAPYHNILAELLKNPVDSPMKELQNYVIYAALVAFVYAVCQFIDTWCWNQSGSNVAVKLRRDMFNNLMRCDVEFFDRNPIGGLLTLLSEDSKTIQNAFGTTKSVQIQSIARFLLCTILTFIYDWKMGLILFSSSIILTIIYAIFLPKISQKFAEKFTFVGGMVTIAQESISSIRTVRSYNQENSTFDRFHDQSAEATQRESFVLTQISFMFDFLNVVFWAAYVVCFYYGCLLVSKGNIGIGQLLAFTSLCFTANVAVGAICNNSYIEARALEAGVRIMQLAHKKPNIPFDGGIQLNDFKGHIVFQNVSFKYPTRDVYALKNVSFEVKPCQIVALVGHSGSGKSTCVQLIERYYDVTEGTILIDGHDIKTIDPRWLHRQIALVSQEPTLFRTTIRANILYGSHSATEEQILDAVEIANAKKFIEKFPNKFEEMIGEKGVSLSGGQKQRIAIARAVIRDPVVLLTDEATSALDTNSERKVQKALDGIMKNRTSIVVAHRLSTIKNAGKIYVFDSGEIKESGSHEELVAIKGFYYNLVERQLGENDSEEENLN